MPQSVIVRSLTFRRILVEKVRNLRRCPPKIERRSCQIRQILTLNGTVGSRICASMTCARSCRADAERQTPVAYWTTRQGTREYRQRDAKKLKPDSEKAESNTRTDEDHNPNCSYHGPDDRRGTQWVCCTDR